MRKFFLFPLFLTFAYSSDVYFDAVDIFRNPQTNREISTKIVNRQFRINLIALNSTDSTPTIFKGTICARVETSSGTPLSPWSNSFFNNATNLTMPFKISAASKDNVIKMMWKKDTPGTCLELENSFADQIVSSDHFAIRPKAFCLHVNNTQQISGDKFFIDFKALDFEHSLCNETSSIINYNEDVNDTFIVTYKEKKEPLCIRGVFKSPIDTNWSFNNANKQLEVEYSEMGEININMSDKSLECEKRFAKIDCKDKYIAHYWDSQKNTAINDGKLSMKFFPKQFHVNATLKNFNNGKFTYLTKDISNMYALHDINISATNEKNETVKNYDKNCYGRNSKLSLTYNKLIDNTSNPLTTTPEKIYFKEESLSINKSEQIFPNEDKKLETILSKFIFEKGKINVNLKVNFTKDKLLSPFKFSLKTLALEEIASTNKIKANTDSTKIDSNATFFYGRIKIPDLITMQKNLSNYATYEVYDTNSSYPWIQNSMNWYKNMWHTTNSHGRIKDIIPTMINEPINANTNKLTISKPLVHVGAGGQDIKLRLENPNNSEDFTLHVKIDPWLWYSNNTKIYNDIDSSSCLQHPCFDVYYKKDTTKLQSGELSGSDVVVQEVNSSIKKGVKIFR